ncbi:tRNA (uracil(54)-C(5))-methyltransferase homolog isoform X2 [Anneissia japonica]|nr:tRNA (uracil(54)-C(5))-methyltransferase homolog isoform X2 [Anneissia japonica]XP_033106038.1 tRNA (uracil(54)-C(5))-methyltransferase homolog isoform X2 [Anneissia japonica]
MMHATCPLWKIPYEMQLKLKYLRMKSLLQKLTNELIQLEAATGNIRTLTNTREHAGLCCPLSEVIPSPQVEGYRNKSDFSVGVGQDGNEKTVGMLVGSWKKKNVVCVSAEKCLNISSAHKRIGKLYEEFLRQSPLGVMLVFHDDGHWRGCTVRSNLAGNMAAIVQFNPRSLNQSQLDIHKEDLKQFFLKGNQDSITSLFLQSSSKTRTYDDSSIELLHGERYLYEKLHDLTFRISPLAFFQPNTKCAEMLYSTIKELLIEGSEKQIVLVDLYCGTGTIGLYLARSVHKVIGIEIVEQAVRDAKVNAEINGINNAEFVCGSVEKVLPHVLSCLEPNQEVLAVVDPARSGIHSSVVKTLRNCESIRRLIYVSCKPEGESFTDFIKLCQPDGEDARGQAWYPNKAVPVDMFPHTMHSELVIKFEREASL